MRLKTKKKKEKREDKEIFQQQIENNSHESAKNLKQGLVLLVKSLDDIENSDNNFKNAKAELSEILYRSDIGDYEKDKEIRIDEKDKEIFQPILDFRKELDSWDTLTESKIADFKNRLLKYTKDVFGMEILKPKEGEKYKINNETQVSKVEETKNELLNGRIKKMLSPGFKINEKLYNEYKNWFAEKEQEMSKKWRSIKDTVSKEEFDKITEEDKAWLKNHSFTKLIMPMRIEIYKYKAE
ncbi:MAG: hypothetical protein KGJ58_03570 [Patescibacteria group bacterium]|nr:hypothetical protein [Patescibacteria group bacterium]MDE2218502.1 hypothetical protein [Patescibacteria group bacterium]